MPSPRPLRKRLTQELRSFLYPLKHFLLYHGVHCKLKRNENHNRLPILTFIMSPYHQTGGGGGRAPHCTAFNPDRARKHLGGGARGVGAGETPALWDPSPDQATRPLTAHLSPTGSGYGISRSLPYIHILWWWLRATTIPTECYGPFTESSTQVTPDTAQLQRNPGLTKPP